MSVGFKCTCGWGLSMDHEVAVQCTSCGRWVTNVDWWHPEEVVVEGGFVFRRGSEWGRLPLSHPAFDHVRADLV